VRLSKCQGNERHYFHIECLLKWFEQKPSCPYCKQSYGIQIGNQPDGQMQYTYINESCQGHENYGTIKINFSFPSGIQNNNHQHPGRKYHGDARDAYLPNNKEGQEMLKLIEFAWQRRLIFTVGHSVTRGHDDVIVWDGIHMKTNMYGGAQNYGWPDPTYFQRVKLELKEKGIDVDDIDEDEENENENENEEDTEEENQNQDNNNNNDNGDEDDGQM